MFVSFILAKVRLWLRYHDPVHELELLSDRDLADLGIQRSEIRAIALQATLARRESGIRDRQLASLSTWVSRST
jgi:uncharacterized protein YjiS (DUF1127 family)